MQRERGRFITVEGIDGCGKSTQTALLRDWLEARLGFGSVLHTFEPGGWEGGRLLRQLLLEGTPLGFRTEILLFLADRSGHLDTEIMPALERGCHVLCERYADSTLAYQAWGRGASAEELERLTEWCGFPSPDLTVLLDIDADTACSRVGRRSKPDRLESGGADFASRVAQGYRELARRYPERIVTVDAGQSVECVAEAVRECVGKYLRIYPEKEKTLEAGTREGWQGA